MLDPHSEARQSSTCCRPWAPGWFPPSDQFLRSQRYLASMAWCEMTLRVDFLKLHRWFFLLRAFYPLCSPVLSPKRKPRSKIVGTTCWGSNYFAKTLAYLVLTFRWLCVIMWRFSFVLLPWRNSIAAFFIIFRMESMEAFLPHESWMQEFIQEYVRYVRNVGHLAALSQRRSEHLT